MRRALLISTLFFCFSAGVEAQSSQPKSNAPPSNQPVAAASASPAPVQAARASFAKLPLSFEENQGQTDRSVKYLSRGLGYSVFLTADQAVFALRGGASLSCAGVRAKINPDCANPAKQSSEGAVLWLKMLGANASEQVTGIDPLPGKINYYIGNDPSKWRTGVRQFGRVTYRGIYPGVDLTYYGNQQQLESDFVVEPGASPRSIEFQIQGARGTHLDEQGNLILATAAGEVQLLRPGVFQIVNGVRRDVSGKYVIRGEDRIGLEIASYDKHSALIIDPVFVYSTYLGGSNVFFGGDAGNAIAVDSTGAAYVTGSAGALDFPGSTPSGPVAQFNPAAFVTKFDPTGNSLVYSTLLRGSTGFNDIGNGIAVNGTNAYVTGVTNDADFPLLNPFQATLGDDPIQSQGGFIQSGFVTGLASDGTLLYSTFLGGRNNDDFTNLRGLAVDSAGNAYVVGDTTSQNFPTVNPLQATNNSFQTAVVAKFNPQGQPIYSTYLGGTGSESGYAIAVDSVGNAYVTGQTSSPWNSFPAPPASPAPFQAANNGGEDAFVAKLNFNTGSQTLTVAALTFLGGDNSDTAYGIAVDAATPPNVYLTGQTSSTLTGTNLTPFPTKNPLFGPNNVTPEKAEAFVTELKGDFTALLFSTFLGGTNVDIANAIAIDGSTPPNVFVTGSTGSQDFPVLNPLQLASPGSGRAFVTEININGASSALRYSTYLGGSGGDQGSGIAVDATGNAYITGSTTSVDFPVLSSSGVSTKPFQDSLRSSTGNAFITKISPSAAPSGLNFNPPVFNYHEVGVGSFSSAFFTLSNNSASSVTINSFTPSGTNAGDFTVQPAGTTCTNSLVLTAGSSCIVAIRFAPQDQDTRSAQVGINSTPTSTTVLTLSGFGAVPEIALNPTSINFGTNVPLNVPAFNGVTITNTGGATLHVGSVQITGTGTDASAFNATLFGCAAVAPHQSCSVSVTFTPTAARAYNATLLINYDAVGSPQSLPMTGTGVGQVILSPTSAEFFGWLVGTSSTSRQFFLTNGTSGNITLGSITPGGSNPGDFPVDSSLISTEPTCVANLVMLPGVTCDFSVHFAPTAGSAIDGRTATYTFAYTGALAGSQSITLMGAGETGVTLYENILPGPKDPPISTFVGATERRTQIDQLFNGTASPITVTGITLSGANPGDFAIELDNTCSINGTMPANSVCFLDGAFSPSALGTRTATATIHYTPPSGSSLTLNITGTGIPGPVNFPSFLDFGSQIVGLTGSSQRVVLENFSKVPLQISSVSGPSGTNAGDFAISADTCLNAGSGILVPAGGKCFLDLQFTPGSTGSRTATITVTDNGPGSPRILTLKGTGVPGSELISVTPSALDFGNAVLNQTATATFYLTNGGTQPTTISVVPALTTPGAPFAIITGTNNAVPCSLNLVVLPQGATCSVVVTFKPTAAGLQTNSVTLTDTVGGLHTVQIQGTGVTQGVLSVGAPATFTQLPSTTTTPAQNITVTNTGNGPLTLTVISLTGTNASDFAIVPSPATTCAAGAVIPPAPGPGNTCVIALTFTAPVIVGKYTGNLLVTANLGNNVKSSSTPTLNGVVVSGGFAVTPAPPLDFGTLAIGDSQNFGTVSGANFITLTNNNTSSATISSIAPQTAGDFTVPPFSNFCLKLLKPGDTCNFDVTFAPTSNGLETNNILVTYTGASGSPFQIPVKGTGSNALVATPNPANVTGSTSFSGSVFITIANGSTSTVNISSLSAITGANAAAFSIPNGSDSCTGQQLAATGSFPNSCFVSVTFKPTASGNMTAQFTVNYTVGSNPAAQALVVNLNGTATAPQISINPNSVTPLVFGDQVTNTQSLVLNVIVTNTGTDSVFFSGFKITGTNANDFALGPPASSFITSGSNTGCQFGLDPGKTCTIPLTFTPSPLTALGKRNATLTITDNAAPGNGTQTVLLEGNSVGGSVFTDTINLTFPQTNIGSSNTQAVLLSNTTPQAVTFNSVGFTGPYTSDTGANSCVSGKSLSAFTGACTIYIKFSPTGTSNPGTATVHYNGSSTLPVITLSGTGSNPSVNATPNPLTFVAQLVGTQSGSQAVTLSNPTGSSVSVTGTTITGTNASDFIFGTNACTGANLPATTGTCVVNVIFKPGSAGGTARTATLSITASDVNSPHTVTLNGTAAQPVVSLSSGSAMAFGNVNLGATSGQQTVTLSNTGNATLTISNVALGGTNLGDFASATPASGTDCRTASTVAAGASCVVAATFTPTGLNARSATITITDNAAPTTQTINLSGTGTQPSVGLAPSTIPFGNQRLNTTSAQQTSTLTNSGTGPLTITSVTLGGTNSGDFALATPGSGTDCRTAGTVAVGGTCIIAATFTPTALGGRTATISVADSATGSPHTVTLTGTGTFPQATPTPSPVAFNNQRQNTTSGVQVLTLSNGGTDTLHVTTVALGGTNASEFAIVGTGTTCTNGATVAAGGTCIVNLTFTPTALGSQTATVTFADDANPVTQVVTLTGTGVFPQASATPSPVAFNNQRENTTSAVQTVTLTNAGTGTLNLATVVLGGTNANQFAIVGTGTTCTNGSTVLAGASCVLKLTFTPTALGSQTATVTFTDDASPTTQAVTLTGTGVLPQASPAPATVPFGNQSNGTTSAPQTVTLTNGGNGPLTLATVALGGTNPGAFAMGTGTTCTNGATVLAGASCVVHVTFTPTGLTPFSATLTFTDDANPITQTVTLTGTGVTSTVNFSPSPVAFNSQRLNTTSGKQTSTLSNNGSTTLTITSVTLTGTNSGDFALATPGSGTDCRTAGTVAAGGTCIIAATFTPTALGSRTATISVADSATGSPHTVTLTGTGTFPQATPTPSPVAFNNQRQNTTSGVQVLTLSNGGTDTLHVTTVALGGTNASEFAIVGTGTTCTNGATVAAGGTCIVNLTFTPTALGSQTATVTFADDANPVTQVVTLTGTGVFPQASATPSPVAFNNQRENTTSAVQTLTLTNAGTGTLNLTTVVLGGTNANQFAIVGTGTTCTNGATVAAGSSCVLKLTFTPTALGSQTATVTFTDDASPTTQAVTLTGTGVLPQASPAPATVPFGNQSNGTTSAPQTVTLTNGGNGPLTLATVALGGTNPGAFAMGTGTTCTNGATVLAGASCVVHVTFTPTGLTPFSATLTFTDDANPITQTVTLTGTGVTSTVNFSPSPVAFNSQRLNTTSGKQTSTLSNNGSTTLTITSVTLTGTNSGDFALATPASGTDCRTAGTVAAGGTCIIAATFTPTALGSRTATISVADSATGSPHTVTLTGTGIAPAASLSTNTVAFVNQIISTTSAAQTVTLTNSGTDVLHIATVALGGTNPADFAIATGTTCTNGATVAPGSTCLVNLTFTPATANPFSATLTFTDDDGAIAGSTQVVALSGTGATPPTATLSTTSVPFGNQRVGTTSTATVVTITNSGDATLAIAGIALDATGNQGDFALSAGATNPCPLTAGNVSGHSSCKFNIVFKPTAINARAATVNITDNGNATGTPGTKQTVALTGNGIAPSVLLAPTTVPFGNQEVSTSTAAQNGTLSNTGSDVLDITAVTITGANASDFSIVAAGTSCAAGLPTAVTVAATKNCTWSVIFTPTTTGLRTASLTFTDDDAATPGSTQSVTLNGTGTAPVVVLAPTTVTFPPQVVGTPSAAQGGTLTNTGNTALHLATVAITGANSGDFTIVPGGTCANGSTVAATTGSCTWSVIFTPSAIGTRTATLTFTDDNNGVPNSKQTVTLTGTTPPAATLSPSTPVAFGNQGVGTTSAATSITVNNPGGSTLHIATLAISGTNAADFAIASTGTTCTAGSTVAVGASCTINLAFTPAAAGARGPATLTITDDASPSTTQTVSMSGTGIDFTLAVPTPPAPATAGQPISATIQVSPLTGTSFPNVVTFSATNLPPNSTVTFTPPSVTPGNAAATTIMKLTTTARSTGSPRPSRPTGPISGGWIVTALLALLGMMTIRRGIRMQRLAYLPLAVLLLSAAIITGCTSGPSGTAAGNYNVTVTATSGSLSHSTTVAVTVQ